MKFAEITIVIEVDESKLTKAQQKQAKKSDTDLTADHPVSIGVELVVSMLEKFVKQRFAYLLDGREAVSFKIEE